MKAISILGLGWLGLPLADLFIHKGYSVAGTTTSIEKCAKISNTSLSVVTYKLYEHSPNKIPLDYFENSVLVLNIPPGRKNFDPKAYVKDMLALIDHAFKHGLKQLVFISTTSVFGETPGMITKRTLVAPVTDSAKALVQIESHIKANYYDKSCIVRPAGLVGPSGKTNLERQAAYRHPIYSLVKREQLDSGENPVNLVHQADLLKVIAVIIDNEVSSASYNLSALTHTSRREYYTWCASQLGLPAPNFADVNAIVKQSKPTHKIIDATETLEDLGICLAYPSPFDMLPER